MAYLALVAGADTTVAIAVIALINGHSFGEFASVWGISVEMRGDGPTVEVDRETDKNENETQTETETERADNTVSDSHDEANDDKGNTDEGEFDLWDIPASAETRIEHRINACWGPG